MMSRLEVMQVFIASPLFGNGPNRPVFAFQSHWFIIGNSRFWNITLFKNSICVACKRPFVIDYSSNIGHVNTRIDVQQLYLNDNLIWQHGLDNLKVVPKLIGSPWGIDGSTYTEIHRWSKEPYDFIIRSSTPDHNKNISFFFDVENLFELNLPGKIISNGKSTTQVLGNLG